MSERRDQQKRERRRRKRRDELQRRRADDAEHDPPHVVIGYFASSGMNAVCDRAACVIADSEATMRRLIDHRMGVGSATRYQIRQTTFAEILAGLRHGAPYAFEPAAYLRFRPLAERAGVSVAPERSETPQPGAVHLVRVQWVGG
jgi:hypothetical protein